MSKAQRRATAIAEHDPDELYARNRGMLAMTPEQLHDFAATSEATLPARVRHVPGGSRSKRRNS